MISKDNSCSLVSIQENLCFHAIKTELYGNINSIIIFCYHLLDFFFYLQFVWQWWDIRRTANSNWNASDSTAFSKEAFIYKFSDMAKSDNLFSEYPAAISCFLMLRSNFLISRISLALRRRLYNSSVYIPT